MAEPIDTETHKKMADEMNQADLTSETETAQQQMVELQPLLLSQPSDPSHNHFQQHMAEATDSDENAPPLVKSSANHASATTPKVPSWRSNVARTHDPRSPHSSQQEVEDEVIIKIDEVIRNCGDGLLLPNLCIYRVPIMLRYLKEEAYTPKFVSIGPFHYGNKRLQDMERHKHIMFKRFTKRAKLSLDDLVGRVKLLVPEVRASYSEAIILSEVELMKLTLVDAGFIIELLVMWYDEFFEDADAKLSQPWLDDSIRKDLILIENQLPFFAIETLFNEALPHDYRGSPPPFLEIVYKYFGHYNRQNIRPSPEVKIKHFTDLIRLFYMQGERSGRYQFFGNGGHLIHNANALHEAGIRLKACESKCLLDLKLSGLTLEIPQIFVEDDTELLFRNMIALELCHYPSSSYITDYATLLDCLIDTHKDVDLLIQKKIVRHCLDDSQNVAELFNGLGKNVLQLNFNSQYLDISKSLNCYCCKKEATLRREYCAPLRRDYCNTPWRTLASITGIILIVLTIVQAIFSVLQVVLK